MALRIAIVGPGRVGTAFAHRLKAAGATVLGFVGRDAERTRRGIATIGVGEPLGFADLQRAHVVVFAVGDSDLREAVQTAAGYGARRCSMWLHTSGCHGLDVFDPAVDLDIRIGSLHPLLPLAGGEVSRSLAGGLALLVPGSRSERLLHRLCQLLGFEPIVCGEQNRALYHAACSLAANGATALVAAAADAMQAAGGLPAADAERIVMALAAAAIRSSTQVGPGSALSGPVRRGDAATVATHVRELRAHGGAASAAYVALMGQALQLARAQGLDAEVAERVAAELSGQDPPN